MWHDKINTVTLKATFPIFLLINETGPVTAFQLLLKLLLQLKTVLFLTIWRLSVSRQTTLLKPDPSVPQGWYGCYGCLAAGVMLCSITWSSRIEFGMLKRSHALPLWPSAGRFYTSHCSHQLEVTCPHSMYMYWSYFLVWMLNKMIHSEFIHHLLNL